MVLSFLFFLFIAYLVYRLTVNFILPIYRTTQQVKKTFRTMRDQHQPQSASRPAGRETSKNTASSKVPASEYIDFEEIKN